MSNTPIETDLNNRTEIAEILEKVRHMPVGFVDTDTENVDSQQSGKVPSDPRTMLDCYDQFKKIGLYPRQVMFLCAFIESCGVLHLAVKAAKINRWSHYNWLNTVPVYREAFAIAQRLAADNLLAVATQRAAMGVMEPHWYKDEVVGHTIKFSDQLMTLLLKGEFPDKYKDRSEIEDKRAKGILERDPGREILTDQRIEAMITLADKAIAAGINKVGTGEQKMIETQIPQIPQIPEIPDNGNGNGKKDADA